MSDPRVNAITPEEEVELARKLAERPELLDEVLDRLEEILRDATLARRTPPERLE